MRLERLQRFLLAASLFMVQPAWCADAPLSPFEFTDVDHNLISTGDGRISVLVLTQSSEVDKARAVGDRIPDFCFGNPGYRFVTVLTFTGEHSGATRAFLAAVTRHRLDGEARRLQPRYTARQSSQDPRKDVCAVLDFDGTVCKQLGIAAGEFGVVVLGRKGELLQHWTEIPTTEQLAAVLK